MWSILASNPDGALGYSWMTSHTLRAAFERLVRFRKILNDDAHLELRESGGSLSLVVWKSSEKISPAFRIDGAMALLLAMVQSNAGN